MAKYNIKRRHSKTLDLSLGKRYRPLSTRIYKSGGMALQQMNQMSEDALGEFIGSGSGMASGISSVLGAAGTMVDTFNKNNSIADTTGIESSIEDTQNANFSTSSDTTSLLDSWNNINWQNSDYTMKDVRGVSGGEMAMNTISAVGSGAAAGAQVGGPWGAVAGAAIGLGSGLAGIFTRNKKAREKAEELNSLARKANTAATQNFDFQAETMERNQYKNLLANIAAEGGPIHIKKKNRGKFTASAERAGMGVQEFARHVLANKDKYSSTLVKRANFAKNAAGWKHDLGGNLFTHGGDWSNGVQLINQGGTHEQNPFEGVPMGVAPDGQPNLVEEGEVIFKDYVFSNRLHLTDKELKEANLPRKYKGYTFALAAEDLSKESSERPNDPISRKGLEDSLGKLSMIQEQQRMKKGKKGTQQMMAFGGRKYSGDLNLPDITITGKRKAMPTIIDTVAYSDLFRRTFDDERIREFLASVPTMESEENINALDSAFQEEALANLPKLDIPAKKTTSTSSSISKQNERAFPTMLRYAPAIGSAIGSLVSAFEKPDYSNSDLVLNAANSFSDRRVSYRPINNYLTYKPLDRNYYLNQLKGQAGATRAAIRNSGSNPGQIMAGLLAADYNAHNAVGDTLMKMDMYNQQQKQAVEQFNRGTNQYNSQMGMQADAQNAQLASIRDKMRLAGITTAAGMREATDTALANSKSMNLTNFFDNLGAIGQENFIMNQIASNPSLYYNYINSKGTVGHKNKRGGMLTKKNRRRR